MIKDIKSYLSELGFSRNESGVYLALAKLGEARASQIAKLAALPRTTTISILNKLVEGNYITSHIYKGLAFYWIESPQVLLDNLNYKMDIAQKLAGALPDLYHSDGHFPVAKFFDTKKAIKAFIEKTLAGLEKGSIIYTIDTPNEGNYSKIFSDDARSMIFSLKKKKGLMTKTLVPAGSYKEIAEEKIVGQDIVIRELPVGLKFQASMWFVKDMVISLSGNPPFLTVIRHADIVTGFKNLYDFLWNISSKKQ